MHETIFNQNKSCKVLFLSFILIASITKYMCTKFYEVWTIICKVIAMSGYSGVDFRLKYSHAVVTFYTFLLGISSDGDHGLKCGHYVPTIFILV